jgi:glucosyl-3-phosphoglycerate synthase
MDTVANWFDRRTFTHDQFGSAEELVIAKQAAGLTISVCVPTRNEAATIGPIVRLLRQELVENVPLLDELTVMDAGSDDDTGAIAAAEGATVFVERDVLPEEGQGSGKGEGLWKSVHACTGDILAWVDADIANFHPHFVTGLVGPLLADRTIGYTKGFYQRPIRVGANAELHPTEGGRVTELLARPLLNAFWPALAGLVQPLSGEFAGRRELLERIPFYSGYGVELGLLVDIFNEAGIDAIAQVDLERRVHRNQEIAALSRMSFGILQTAMAHLAEEGRVVDGTWATEYTQYLQDIHSAPGERSWRPATRELTIARRPPLAKVAGYLRRRDELTERR